MNNNDAKYIKIPKAIVTSEKYKDVSIEAKFLYALIYDKLLLSIDNKEFLVDERGKIYTTFMTTEVMESMRCCDNKATALLRELESNKLILRKRRGLGKPNAIYVDDSF